MNQIQKLLMISACFFSLAASAQWQWIDKDGRKVFSDRAPPIDVLDKNILKRPSGRSTPALTTNTASSPALPASAPLDAASTPKLSGINKELLENKKKAEEAETAKRKAEEEKVLKAKIENCALAKQAKTTFDSGIRIARTNEKGEREVMDDVARAAELKRIQSIIHSDCN